MAAGTERVGFIGLAYMGRPMAASLAAKGFALAVFDLDAARVTHGLGAKDITALLTATAMAARIKPPRR